MNGFFKNGNFNPANMLDRLVIDDVVNDDKNKDPYLPFRLREQNKKGHNNAPNKGDKKST